MRTGAAFSVGTSAARPVALAPVLLAEFELFFVAGFAESVEGFVVSVVGTALSDELVIEELGLGAALAASAGVAAVDGAGGCEDAEGSDGGEGFGAGLVLTA
jgi:hypothetical protein